MTFAEMFGSMDATNLEVPARSNRITPDKKSFYTVVEGKWDIQKYSIDFARKQMIQARQRIEKKKMEELKQECLAKKQKC